MPRKARKAFAGQNLAKNTLVTVEIMENYFEPYFSAIKQDFNAVAGRFDKMENTLKTILDIVRVFDVEKKEIKLNLWEHDRRIVKLEKSLV